MRKLEMRKNNTKGRLITFCGLDGCGKSTMIEMLNDWLARMDKDVFLTKQPTDFVRNTPIFRTYMDNPNHDSYDYRSLSLLAASDRVQHCNKVILPQLEKGRYVISDRYMYSCIANLRARGYSNDMWIYEIAESIVKPDLAIVLDVPVDIAVARVRNRIAEKDSYIDMDLQYRLRDEYLKLAETNGGIVLSSYRKAEETFSDIKSCFIKKLGGVI